MLIFDLFRKLGRLLKRWGKSMTRIVINGIIFDVPGAYPHVGKVAGPTPGKIGNSWKQGSKWIPGSDNSATGPLVPVIPVTPSNTSIPTIEGVAQVGQTLNGNVGVWLGTNLNFLHRWLVDDVLIPGAFGGGYMPIVNDIGKTIKYRAIGNNSLGTATGTSLGTSAVIAAATASPSVPALTISAPVSQNEGNSGTTNFTYTVTRTGDLSAISSAYWAVTGTANAADFVGNALPSGTINFPIGSATQNIVVPVAGDTAAEATETFTVTLSSPVNATIAAVTVGGTIVNDDAGAVLDTAINPPIYTLSSKSVFPPQLNFILDETSVQDTDTLEIEVSTNREFSTLLFTLSRQLTAANIAGANPIATFTQLATLVSPDQTFFRPRIVRGGTSYSNWGVTRKHGDITPSVYTANTAPSFPEASPVLYALGANEPGTWRLVGPDAGLIEIYNNDKVRLVGNASPNYPTKAVYNFNAMHTDDASNITNTPIVMSVVSLDRVPDQFAFTQYPTANPTTPYTASAAITGIAPGITQSGTIAGTGIEWRKNDTGAWLAPGPINVQLNDNINLRTTTGAYSSFRTATVTVGVITANWNVNVIADPTGVAIYSGVQPVEQSLAYATNVVTDTITVPAGDLWIVPRMESFARVPQTVTCNGVNVPLVYSTQIVDGFCFTAFRLANVTAGAKTIVVTWNSVMGGTQTLWFSSFNANPVPVLTDYEISGWHGGGERPYKLAVDVPVKGAAILFSHAAPPQNFGSLLSEKGAAPNGAVKIGVQVDDGVPSIITTNGGGVTHQLIVLQPA